MSWSEVFGSIWEFASGLTDQRPFLNHALGLVEGAMTAGAPAPTAKSKPWGEGSALAFRWEGEVGAELVVLANNTGYTLWGNGKLEEGHCDDVTRVGARRFGMRIGEHVKGRG